MSDQEASMTLHLPHPVSCLAFCAIAGVFALPIEARAQADFGTPPQSEALSHAAKASPKLVKALAKELDSTPEQAAGAAGVIFAVAKVLLPPEDFGEVAKAVPGMDALLAAVPKDEPGTTGAPAASPGSTFTPGFASSSPSTPAASTPGVTMAASGGMASVFGGLSKLGIKPEMIAKAVPFLSGYLKKNGGKAVGAVLGSVFKTGK
jgi:hypothetical protein